MIHQVIQLYLDTQWTHNKIKINKHNTYRNTDRLHNQQKTNVIINKDRKTPSKAPNVIRTSPSFNVLSGDVIIVDVIVVVDVDIRELLVTPLTAGRNIGVVFGAMVTGGETVVVVFLGFGVVDLVEVREIKDGGCVGDSEMKTSILYIDIYFNFTKNCNFIVNIPNRICFQKMFCSAVILKASQYFLSLVIFFYQNNKTYCKQQ